MRKHLSTNLFSSAIICLGISLSSFDVHSATARISITKLQSEGFRACKSLGHSGWTGLVSANSLDGGSQGTFREFRVRYCFSSQSECQQFINNFQNIVTNLDSIRLKKCSPRG